MVTLMMIDVGKRRYYEDYFLGFGNATDDDNSDDVNTSNNDDEDGDNEYGGDTYLQKITFTKIKIKNMQWHNDTAHAGGGDYYKDDNDDKDEDNIINRAQDDDVWMYQSDLNTPQAPHLTGHSVLTSSLSS